MIGRRFDRMTFALAALAAFSAGCYTTHIITPAELASDRRLPRVQLVDGRRSVEIEAPELYGDTLSGLVDGVPSVFVLSGGMRLETRNVAVARSAAVALVASGALFAALMYSSPDHTGAAPASCSCPNVSPGCPAIPCPVTP
jgi:hypothetical protein